MRCALAVVAMVALPAASRAAGPEAAVGSRAGNGPLAPHPGPPVFLELSLEPTGVRAFLHGEQQVLGEWLGFAAPLEPVLAEDARAELLGAAGRALPELGRIRLDGEPATARGAALQVLGPFAGAYGAEPSLTVELELGGAVSPDSVEVEWLRFAADTRGGTPKMPVHLRAEGAFDYVVLVPEEPAWTWHAPTERGLDLAPSALAARGSGGASGEGLPLLLLAVAGGLAGMAAHGGRRLTAAVAAGLGLLVCAWWTLAGPTRIAVPRGDAARALHEELLRRVYAGFDATTEQGVFRALQGSVTAELLEPLYQGIRESLVMADEGGAVCRVERVEVLDAQPSARASAAGASFVVDSEWRVDGRVIHFGHEHARRTRYRGEVTISARPEEEGPPSWRISGLQVREQVREPLPEDASAAPGRSTSQESR